MDSSLSSPTGIAVNVVHAIRCTTAGQLTVQWTKVDDGDGNVTLQSIVVLPTSQ